MVFTSLGAPAIVFTAPWKLNRLLPSLTDQVWLPSSNIDRYWVPASSRLGFAG